MKVLIISHTCFSTYNNMGKTFLSLFKVFDKSELCQLYIYPSIPDVDVCSSYYRITDKEILKNLFFRRSGHELTIEELTSGRGNPFENEEDAAIYTRKSNSSSIVRLLRDFMWKVSRWDTPQLREWIETQRPTHIFLAPGYAKFIYDIAIKISKRYSLPMITYICDDYYFVNSSGRLFDKIQHDLLKRKMMQLMRNTSAVVGITREICSAYADHFCVRSNCIMTGTSYISEKCVSGQPGAISYFGNIGLNRYKSILTVGKMLLKLNHRYNKDYKILVYSSEKNQRIISELTEVPTIKFMGFVSGHEFERAFFSSQLLLYVESFSEKDIDTVKYSLSTKLAESIGSGIPIIAYGPSELSSIKHLKNNCCAFVSDSVDGCITMLETAFFDGTMRSIIAENALKTARSYHDSEQQSKRLYRYLQELCVT